MEFLLFSYKTSLYCPFRDMCAQAIFRNNHKSMVKPPGQFIALQAINALKETISDKRQWQI